MVATLVVAAVAVATVAVLDATRAYTAKQTGQKTPASSSTTHAGTRTPTPSPSASASAHVASYPIGRAGKYRVAQRWYEFTEDPASGAAPRDLKVLVRIPVVTVSTEHRSTGLFPLVAFAPGYLQCPGSYSALLQQWSSAGYVVAAVQFPRTNCDVAKPDENDLTNQPADVAFVINRLVSLSGQATGWLAGLIDASRIAVAGHSDGGDTVAALAAAGCCRDRSVRAAIILAGAEWPAFSHWFVTSTPPILFVQGSADTINPPKASMLLYQADTTGPRYYLDLLGANHFTPYEGRAAPEPVVARVTLDFLDTYLAGEESSLAAMQQAGQAPGAVLESGGAIP